MAHAALENPPTPPQAAPPHHRRSRWIEGGLIVAFWGIIFLLTVSQDAIDPRGSQGLVPRELLHTGLEHALWLLMTPGIFWLSRRFSLERENWPRHLLLHIVVAVAVALAVDLFGHATSNALLAAEGRRLRPVTLAFSLFSLHLLDELIIYLVVLAAGFARDYFLRYQDRQQEAVRLQAQTAQLQAQLAEARLEALRMQINPHFLFNTLHAISSLAGRDPHGVRRMIARLSELLRYALESSSAQEVPLREELQFLRGYLEIQRIRFQGRLDTELDIPSETLGALVPSLILQPLVENAIKHGASQIEGLGRVEVHARREGARLVLSVCDNGPGLSVEGDAEEGHQGVGLANTRERLQSLYGTAQSLTLAPTDRGFRAQITLPYHTADDLYAAAPAAHETPAY